MIFTPQNHATKMIQATRLNRNQQTGTVEQQNQRPYSRPMEKVRRNDRMMPAGRVDLKIFGVDMVDVTPQEYNPRKDRNRKNKWGERGKDWRNVHWRCKCERCQQNKQRDLIAERERTAQALREWREDIDVDVGDTWQEGLPYLSFYERYVIEDYIDWSMVDDYNERMTRNALVAMWEMEL